MTAFRNALVTGASSGIGRAISLELARRGARVVLAARREAELETVKAAIEAEGGVAQTLVLDVSDARATFERANALSQAPPGLDLVVANAGLDDPSAADPVEWGRLERVFRVNTLGALATLLGASGPMRARGRGTLAAVTSLAGGRGLPGHAAYSASKAAVSTYLEALREELGECGLAVVDVRPGFVDTPLTRKNRFSMPFMKDADQAARIIVRGLERGAPVVSFPWQLQSAMKVAELLPDALWRPIARRLPR